MSHCVPLAELRAHRWLSLPEESGVYWWYFPEILVDKINLAGHCEMSSLNLKRNDRGELCLYHGLAKNLSQRIKWHGDQELTLGALSSGFISTFRLTLLALCQIEYAGGKKQIDSIFDQLSVSWQVTSSRREAEDIEH